MGVKVSRRTDQLNEQIDTTIIYYTNPAYCNIWDLLKTCPDIALALIIASTVNIELQLS